MTKVLGTDPVAEVGLEVGLAVGLAVGLGVRLALLLLAVLQHDEQVPLKPPQGDAKVKARLKKTGLKLSRTSFHLRFLNHQASARALAL